MSQAAQITPVRLGEDERSTGRYEVFEETDSSRRVYAWGFSTADQARDWVAQHNSLSPFVHLKLEN